MRHIRLRLGPHTLLFPLDAAASVEDGAAYVGKPLVRRDGFLVPVRDLVAEVLGTFDGGRTALHLQRHDERAVLLVERAETLVDVDDVAWHPLPASLGALASWVDAVVRATDSDPPAYRLCVAAVWRELARIPEAS